jgi:hypothetical protein
MRENEERKRRRATGGAVMMSRLGGRVIGGEWST